MASISPSSRSPVVKRLLKELAELKRQPSLDIWVCPLEDNVLEWHFTVRGPSEGGFSGGRFHGRIIFPAEYPFKAPNIVFLNATGRFEVGKKICLSITAYHPEAWQPSWGVRTALTALISFLPTQADGAIGSIDMSERERRVLAANSRMFKCSVCNCDHSSCLVDESSLQPALGGDKTSSPQMTIAFTTRDPSSQPEKAEPAASQETVKRRQPFSALTDSVLTPEDPHGNTEQTSVADSVRQSPRSESSLSLKLKVLNLAIAVFVSVVLYIILKKAYRLYKF